jgi:hypothetical protein
MFESTGNKCSVVFFSFYFLMGDYQQFFNIFFFVLQILIFNVMNVEF